MKSDGGSFGLIKIFLKKNRPDVSAEVNRKFVDLSRQLKKYEFEQHHHAPSFNYLLVAHFEKEVCGNPKKKNPNLPYKK